MNSTKHALAISIFAAMGNGQNHYTQASVNKIQSLLMKYHGIEIKRRWLFQCMADMEEAGILRRKRRYKKQGQGEIRQRPSLIAFTVEGAKYLVKKRVAGAMNLLKSIMRWLNKDDSRFPDRETMMPEISDDARAANLRRLKALMHGI